MGWREDNASVNAQIERIRMQGMILRMRMERRELADMEFRSWLMWERYKMECRRERPEHRYNHNHDSKGRFASKSGASNGIRLTEITNGAIMKMTKLSKNGDVINPMDETKYNQLKHNLEKSGISVISAKKGSDDERFLMAMQAEAISDDIGILHLGDIPSASAMYEEMIHCTQSRVYGSVQSDDLIERAAREVAANRKLLKNGNKFDFTNQDYDDISSNLEKWEDEFKKRVGVSYDEAGYNRDVSYIIGLESNN